MRKPSERTVYLAGRTLVWIGWVVAAAALVLGTWYFFINKPT
jgi:hypothetical protein